MNIGDLLEENNKLKQEVKVLHHALIDARATLEAVRGYMVRIEEEFLANPTTDIGRGLVGGEDWSGWPIPDLPSQRQSDRGDR